MIETLSEHVTLNLVWFILVGALFTGYAILDGFDLGVGMLNVMGKSDTDRRLLFNSIGPVWDGNEVWLVTGGGALFAAFPMVYATVLSGFYIAFMLLLFAIIFRAVAIEFRSKQPMKWWRGFWDYAFCISSFLSSMLIGVAIGNIAWGIPLNTAGDFTGSFLSLLHPYPVLIGVTTVALFLMHGCIYIVLKTEGDLQAQFRGYINNFIIFFILCYGISTVATLLYLPHMVDVFREFPAWGIIVLANILLIANIPREIHKGRELFAFFSSAGSVLTLMVIFGIGMYPNLVVAIDSSGAIHPELSLNVFNASSSDGTLFIMFIIALLGLPLVMAYTCSVYWIFRGKVKLGENSY